MESATSTKKHLTRNMGIGSSSKGRFGILKIAAATLRAVIITLGFLTLSACTTAGRPAHSPVISGRSAHPQNDEMECLQKFRLAASRGNVAGAIDSLTKLASHWPGSLQEIPYQWIGTTVALARKTPDKGYNLLQALFSARYHFYNVLEPSGFWYDLALLEVQRGDSAAATKVVEQITSPSSIMAILVDHRFASVLATLPHPLTVGRAFNADISDLRTAIAHEPHLLDPVVQLAVEELSVGRFEQVLGDMNTVIAKINANATGATLYTDQPQYLAWILQERSNALYGLSRYDEAVADLETASTIPEAPSARNISQTINLAEVYDDLGRPSKARATLDRLTPIGVSPYGLMAAQMARLEAALQLNDQGQINRSLKYLQDHRSDAIGVYERVLLDMGETEEAEQLLISRLENPEQREGALLAVQDYPEPPEPKWVVELNDRWRSVVKAPAVQAAVARVGSIQHFDIDRAEPSF